MSTAQSEANSETFDHNAARIVRILMAQAEMKPAQLATAVGLSTSVLYTRLNASTDWRGWELAAIANFYNQPFGIFEEAAGEVIRSAAYDGQNEKDLTDGAAGPAGLMLVLGANDPDVATAPSGQLSVVPPAASTSQDVRTFASHG